MSSTGSLAKLSPEEWDRLQEVLDRFEVAWKQARAPLDSVDLAHFLPPRDDPLRPILLHELIKTDLESRWRSWPSLRRELEFYASKFTELGAVKNLPVDLVYEEYRVRHLYADKPPLTTYRERFPDQFEDLQRLLQEHPVPTISDSVSQPSPTLVIPSSASPPAAGGDLLSVGGGYEPVRRIGGGSYGEVWQAEGPGGVEVAIKIIFRPLDHKEAQRELRALELMKRLRHAFLVQIHAFWSLEDRLLIVMDLADGSLRGRLVECRKATGRGIPTRELFGYLRESAEALDYLHGEHVLHCDIKPDNILISRQHAKVADFGLARLCSGQQAALSSAGGTPAYMAPEMWRGQVGAASDLYGLAVTYAEMRLERALFPERTAITMLTDRLAEQPRLDPLPAAEQDVLRRALDPDPERRFRSCGEFVQALEDAVSGRAARALTEVRDPVPAAERAAPTAPMPPPPAADIWPLGLSPRKAALVAALGAVAVIAYVVYLLVR
jgi:hypothetical protein